MQEKNYRNSWVLCHLSRIKIQLNPGNVDRDFQGLIGGTGHIYFFNSQAPLWLCCLSFFFGCLICLSVILVRPVKYRHRFSQEILDNNIDVLSSQEAFESNSLDPVGDNTDTGDGSPVSLDNEVAGE